MNHLGKTILLFILTSNITHSQTIKSSLLLISQVHNKNYEKIDSLNDKKIIQKKSTLSKINPVYWIFSGAMLGYQHVISPQIMADCQYQMSCSNFSKRAIQRFGFIKGVVLSADRLTKCNHLTLTCTPEHRIDSEEKIIEDVSDYAVKQK